MKPAPLADTHCHLCLDAFDDDLDEVLERSRQAGVWRILVPGIDLETSRRAVDLARDHEEIYAAVGVHPHEARTFTPEVRRSLETMARAPKVVAVGEIGLDYYRDLSPRADQARAFADQLLLAEAVGLPVVVHNREATEHVFEHLIPWASRPDHRGVLHAFSSDAATAAVAADAGLYLGIAGPITFPRSDSLREVAAQLPPSQVLLETDSPYLTPHPHRGSRNEPARVAQVAETLSVVWSRDLDATRRLAWTNAQTLFRWSHGTDDRNLL
jgi:TatD DNase family protein